MNDTDKFKLWEIANGKLVESPGKRIRQAWQFHHFIPKKIIKKYPNLISIQKIIQIPYEMHYNLHSGMSDKNFQDTYGIDRWVLLYNVKRHGRNTN